MHFVSVGSSQHPKLESVSFYSRSVLDFQDCKEKESHKQAKRPSLASRRAWEPHFTDHITVLMGATPDDLARISLDSAILDETSIEKPPKFTSSEVEQLKTQLKKVTRSYFFH